MNYRRMLTGFATALPPVLYGWLSFLLVFIAIKKITDLIPADRMLPAMIRYLLSGILVILWLLSWWMFTLIYKRKMYKE